MTSAEEAKRWLASAEHELESARYLARGGYSAQACFGAQQAAEKAVKAVHYAVGARGVLGHSVRGLIERLDPPVSILAALTEEARTLDLYYVPTRYPNGLQEGTPAEAFSAAQATGALECAAQLVAAASAHMSAQRASDPASASNRAPAANAPAQDTSAAHDTPTPNPPTSERAE